MQFTLRITLFFILSTVGADFGVAQVSNPVTVEQGGTGANNATAARVNLGAAGTGANSDITSLNGLTTPLPASEGGTGSTGGVSPTGSLKTTPEAVINIADFGGCSNSQAVDTVNVNAALAAARTSSAYLNNLPVRLVGGFSASGLACAVSQINATGFSAFGGGARLIVEDFAFSCSGTGNICVDTLGSLNVQFNKVTIIGSSSSPPMIGLQEGNTSPTTKACCIHTHYGLEITGSFSFAGLYSAASESTTYYSPIVRNNGANLGVIGTLGTVTGGSGYTNGTYNNVALTGSATGIGAVASIVVSGGAVTSVTLTNQGKQFSVGDVLSAAAGALGGGSGFSVPVSNIGQYSMVLDGQNHWGVSSPFQTVSWSADAYYTFTENNIIGGSLRYGGGTYKGAPLWIGSVVGLRTIHLYMAQQASGPCVALFDNNATSTLHNISENLEIECETSNATYDVQLTGSNPTPDVSGLNVIDPLPTVNTAILGTDAGIVGVTAHNATVSIGHAPSNPPLFSIGTAGLWNFDGFASMPFAWEINAPASQLPLDGNSGGVQNSTAGPMDLLTSYSGVSGAYSCARKLFSIYYGPLCNLRRASDSQSIDFYPNTAGVIDVALLTMFCANTTCYIFREYDQSGNNNTATNATLANQPSVNIEGALHYAICGVWSANTNTALSVPANSSINSLFASGGFASIVSNRTATASNAARLLSKAPSGFGSGWELSGALSAGFNYPQFSQYATTSAGAWVGSNLMPSSGGHIFDLAYSSASLTNLPTLAIDGAAQTFQSSTQPHGTISDTANLVIGNAAAGGLAYPGDICEVVLTRQTPSATQIEAIRRNQALFYRIGGVL